MTPICSANCSKLLQFACHYNCIMPQPTVRMRQGMSPPATYPLTPPYCQPPCRYFAETCATLFATVLGHRETTAADGTTTRTYCLSDSTYRNFRIQVSPTGTVQALQSYCIAAVCRARGSSSFVVAVRFLKLDLPARNLNMNNPAILDRAACRACMAYITPGHVMVCKEAPANQQSLVLCCCFAPVLQVAVDGLEPEFMALRSPLLHQVEPNVEATFYHSRLVGCSGKDDDIICKVSLTMACLRGCGPWVAVHAGPAAHALAYWPQAPALTG